MLVILIAAKRRCAAFTRVHSAVLLRLFTEQTFFSDLNWRFYFV